VTSGVPIRDRPRLGRRRPSPTTRRAREFSRRDEDALLAPFPVPTEWRWAWARAPSRTGTRYEHRPRAHHRSREARVAGAEGVPRANVTARRPSRQAEPGGDRRRPSRGWGAAPGPAPSRTRRTNLLPARVWPRARGAEPERALVFIVHRTRRATVLSTGIDSPPSASDRRPRRPRLYLAVTGTRFPGPPTINDVAARTFRAWATRARCRRG